MSRCASAAALICGLLALAGGIAAAQQAPGLRGPVQEQRVNDDLLGQPTTGAPAPNAATGLTPPPYAPLSPGAVDDESTSTLADPFREPQSGQTVFTDDIPPPRAAATRNRPRTAAERAAEPAGVATRRTQARPRTAQDDMATGTVRAATVDSFEDNRDIRAARDSVRVEPVEGLATRPEDNPYAPLGIRAGGFIVTPTLEQGVTGTTNASAAAGGRSAILSETTLRLDAVSDWSRHSASLRADGTFRRSIAGERVTDIEGGVEGELRLDVSHDVSALAALSYRIAPESASSPVDLGETTSQPLRHTLRGAAGISKDLSRLRLSLTGEVLRNSYDSASLADGTTLSQRDRDNTLAGVRLRAGYEVSPALRPFLEAEYGRRFFDRRRDAGGYIRSGQRYGMHAGVELDLGEKLNGEVLAGWVTERPQDGRLRPVSGLSIGGNLAWSPLRGTIVRLDASTEVEGATAPGASGSLLHAGSVSVSRELRHDLTARALLGLDWRDYAGSSDRDLTLRGEVGLTWWMNRYAGVTGRLRHERQTSTLPGRSFDATSIFLGMTLQR